MTAHSYTLTATGLTRTGAAAITFAAPVGTLNLSTRADVVDVLGTPGPTSVFADGGGDYSVNVSSASSTLSNLGSLFVYGRSYITLTDTGGRRPPRPTPSYPPSPPPARP
jgi:hypothetical protein